MGLFSPFFKAQPHAIRGSVFCNIILLNCRKSVEIQTGEILPKLRQPFPPSWWALLCTCPVLTSQGPTGCFQVSPGKGQAAQADLRLHPHSQTRSQTSTRRGSAMVPSEHQTSPSLHQLDAGPRPPAWGKPLCSHWLSQTHIGISPTTAPHYNSKAWYWNQQKSYGGKQGINQVQLKPSTLNDAIGRIGSRQAQEEKCRRVSRQSSIT